MRQFFKMFFASLLAMIVAGVIIVGIVIALIAGAASSIESKKSVRVSRHPILLIRTGHVFHENGETNPIPGLNKEAAYIAGIWDAIDAIQYAATDKDVKAIYLQLDGGGEGWATLTQFREALQVFRKSGKKIYAYGETISQKDYYLASVANEVYLNPTGMLWFKGLASEMTFYKGTLDKLGVQPEIFYAGKFKSFTEPYRAEKMSEPNRLQIATLQRGIWNLFLGAAAAKSGSDTATVQSWVRTGAVQFPHDAERLHLVDGLRYTDEVEAGIRKDLSLKDEDRDEEGLPVTSIDDYSSSVGGKRLKGDGRIALLLAEGEIVSGKGGDRQIASESFIKEIRRVGRDSNVKAVVLRINSGGGSALASEVMLRELDQLKKRKPLIVSMGDVAASGGYYMACSADSIFALPTTITGSIGVFTMLFNAAPALKDKAGITFDVEKNSPYADFPTVTRELTADEKGRMQQSVDTVYQTFLRRVAAGRRMTVADVDSIAQGRVWSGTDALRIGLVDKLGGLDRALQSAAAKAGLREYTVRMYPEPDNGLLWLRRRLGGGLLTPELIASAIQDASGPVWQALQHYRLLRDNSGRAMMIMPLQATFE